MESFPKSVDRTCQSSIWEVSNMENSPKSVSVIYGKSPSSIWKISEKCMESAPKSSFVVYIESVLRSIWKVSPKVSKCYGYG